MRFRPPNIEFFSFLLGFILSSLLWWVISMLRPAFHQIQANYRLKAIEKKERTHSVNATEERYRQMVILQAQALHLAAPLFSLDEILEPPRLLAPPPRVEPGGPSFSEDIVELTLPYLPAWPELAAIYRAPTLTLSEALSGNTDIILVGQTGMGKTVALASLASRLARHDPETGLSPATLPFLFHVADLDLPENKDNPLNSLIDIISEKASIIDQKRLPDLVRRSFSEGFALLMLDGLDELTPDGLKNVVEFIRAIKRLYPKIRMITTGSCEFLNGLLSMNFIPYALAAWNFEQRAEFLEKWGNLWSRHIAVESWAQTSDQVDPLLLNAWLNADRPTLTTMELTLKAWAAYAGDLRGPTPVDGIETHLRRISPLNTPREALESLAMQVTLAADPIFDPRKARQWVKSFEPNESETAEEIDLDEIKVRKSGRVEQQKTPSLGLLAKMAESGLLVLHRNNRMRFIHPIFAGYLAGKALAGYTDSLLEQPPWIGKYLAMHFLAAEVDATPLSNELLSQIDRPLSRNLLIPARWLRDAPPNAIWRRQVMTRLVKLLQQNGQPLGLRGQVLAALVRSGDPGSAVLFRQMLTEGDPEQLQQAALGSGALQDAKSVELLTNLLGNPSPSVRRSACLALAAIGTTAALDAIGSALLHGDDTLRRAAAEALSNHTSEGHNMLREGAGMKEDLEVRRVVVYGLGRIRQPWAEELLAKLQVEDDQWVVRNAATEMLDNHRKLDKHISRQLPQPSESPWLIAFAGKQGMGVSPDIPPTDLLLMALKSDNPEEQIASLAYLRMVPEEGVFGALYHAMYGGEPDLREAIYQTLSEMAARGVDIPDPVQFGVG
jgi:HEAT repeats/NACHT domain